MRVGVIGAGLAGMTAAYQLAKDGAEVEVFEAGDAVGGMARSLDLWGQTVDLGPHRFFSPDARVNRLWLEVVGDDFGMVQRQTRIFYRRRFFRYPLQPVNALRNMGLVEAARCLLSYARQRLTPDREKGIGPICRPGPEGAEHKLDLSPFPQPETDAADFESWVVDRFGRRLFNMFFKSYSEKLWGIPCSELDADFAAQRIKKFSLGEAIRSALGLARQKHQTLVDRFPYPEGGSGMVCERLAEMVRGRGGRVHLGTPVAGVWTDRHDLHVRDESGRRPAGDCPDFCGRTPQKWDCPPLTGCRVGGIELADGRRIPFQHVVSTMPLTLLVEHLPRVPAEVAAAAKSLTYRNTILVYLLVAGTKLFADQWLYIHSPELRTGRITNFRNWVPQICRGQETSVLALEYWCSDADELWSEDDQRLIDLGTSEVAATGLVGPAAVLSGHVVRLHRSYPVYARGYKNQLAKIVSFLRGCRGLVPIGRYGAFKYNNQDHSILMGLLAAENILHGAAHDLWAVNTDYESYQEAASIEELRRAA